MTRIASIPVELRVCMIAAVFIIVGFLLGAACLDLAPASLSPSDLGATRTYNLGYFFPVFLAGGAPAVLTGFIVAGLGVSGRLKEKSFLKVVTIAVVVELAYLQIVSMPLGLLSWRTVVLAGLCAFIPASVCWLITRPLLKNA
jgi:hypothetical protein